MVPPLVPVAYTNKEEMGWSVTGGQSVRVLRKVHKKTNNSACTKQFSKIQLCFVKAALLSQPSRTACSYLGECGCQEYCTWGEISTGGGAPTHHSVNFRLCVSLARSGFLTGDCCAVLTREQVWTGVDRCGQVCV